MGTGCIDVTLMVFVGQVVAQLLDAESGVALRVNPPLTTTQLPMDGKEDGRFCNA